MHKMSKIYEFARNNVLESPATFYFHVKVMMSKTKNQWFTYLYRQNKFVNEATRKDNNIHAL